MILSLKYYNTTPELLSKQGHDAGLQSLIFALEALPCHYWPEKSQTRKGLSVLQCMSNEHIRQALTEDGWCTEVPPYISVDGGKGTRRCDFGFGVGSERILLEIEFGNTGQVANNLGKLENAYAYDQMSVGVLVVASRELANKTDTGLVTYTGMLESMKGMHPSLFKMPFVLIGISEDIENKVDWTASGYTSPTQLSVPKGGTRIELNRAVKGYRSGAPLNLIGKHDLTEQETQTLSDLAKLSFGKSSLKGNSAPNRQQEPSKYAQESFYF